MKKYILIALLTSTLLQCFAQIEKIPTDIIYSKRANGFFIKEDSLVRQYTSPIIEVNKLGVKIINAFYDKRSKTIDLIGRVSYNDTSNRMGWPRVGLYKGIKTKNNVLTKFEFVTESRIRDKSDSIGFFRITQKYSKGESLFFYLPNFYLIEFRLGELNNYNLKKPKNKSKLKNRRKQS